MAVLASNTHFAIFESVMYDDFESVMYDDISPPSDYQLFAANVAVLC